MTQDYLRTYGTGAAVVAILGFAIASTEYMDIPGIGNSVQAGRTKNSIAAVVTGLVGQQMYEKSKIDVKVQKIVWPDADLTGQTSSTSVNTYVDLSLSKANFQAEENLAGMLEGEVKKSEFNWKVKQTGQNTYEIARFGPKFDATYGQISGTYVRPGPHFNWDISGTYDDNGNVDFEIDGPLNLGIDIVGTIKER